MSASQIKSAAVLGLLACLLAGCSIGPKYKTPTVEAPPAFKELTPNDYKNVDGWKVAQPNDTALRGNWWEIFGDPELNALEDKVNVSNQNIAAAAATFFAARAMVLEARSQLFPTVTTSPSITAERPSRGTIQAAAGSSGAAAVSSTGSVFADYSLPFDATWQPDLFGRVRNAVKAASAGAQASAADLANTRLAIQGDLAADYFELHGQDALKQLLDDTVKADQQTLDLTQALYDTGIDNDEAVTEAQTQLESTQAVDVNVGIQRAQFEHAIAVLVGQPASTFSIPFAPLKSNPPAIPFGVPSQLLERRPDIAASERLVAQANAQIGIAQAAYYPTVTLTGSTGFESDSITKWFSWPSFLFAVGASATETIFDAGLRRATVQQFRSQYDETVANYRQAVLTAFEQVEDELSTLRLLSSQIQLQDAAVASAQKTLVTATNRYSTGLDPYLNVLTAQTTLFSNQQAAVNLRIQQMTASEALIQALGGGWDAAQLPSPQQLISKTP